MRKLPLPKFNLYNKGFQEHHIYMVYRYLTVDGVTNSFRFYTGHKILPKQWEAKTQRAKDGLRNNHSNRELNIFLNDLQAKAVKIVSNNPIISHDNLKIELLKHIGREKINVVSRPTFTDFMETWINKNIPHTGTKRAYMQVANKMKSYSESKRYVLSFENITIDFLKDYTKWVSENGIKSDNTIEKHVKNIKQIYNEATKETIVIDGSIEPLTKFNHPLMDFKYSGRETTKFYLYPEELEALEKIDLSANKSFETVRDYFLLMCYTGLRVSDALTLSSNNFVKASNGDTIIKVYTTKGSTNKFDNSVSIPIIQPLEQLLKKFPKYKFPKPLAEQKHNDYIKEIINLAGITRKDFYKSGSKTDKGQDVFIADHISNHSGRYTFINLMINHYRIDLLQLSKITGQSLKVLQGYERGNKDENAITVKAQINSKKPKLKAV